MPSRPTAGGARLPATDWAGTGSTCLAGTSNATSSNWRLKARVEKSFECDRMRHPGAWSVVWCREYMRSVRQRQPVGRLPRAPAAELRGRSDRAEEDRGGGDADHRRIEGAGDAPGMAVRAALGEIGRRGPRAGLSSRVAEQPNERPIELARIAARTHDDAYIAAVQSHDRAWRVDAERVRQELHQHRVETLACLTQKEAQDAVGSPGRSAARGQRVVGVGDPH